MDNILRATIIYLKSMERVSMYGIMLSTKEDFPRTRWMGMQGCSSEIMSITKARSKEEKEVVRESIDTTMEISLKDSGKLM